jgi:hypothetical protein
MNQDASIITYTPLTILGYKNRVWTIEELPSKSIALDGAVQGFYMDNEQQKYSFDHHGTHRITVRSACSQTLQALLTGLDPSGYKVFINHLDADVILSLCLLRYPELVWYDDVNRFIEVAGLTDNFGPAYPKSAKMSVLLREFQMQVMKPLHQMKTSNTYQHITDLRPLAVQMLNDARAFMYEKIIPSSEKLEAFSSLSSNNLIMLKTQYSVIKNLYQKGIAGGVVYRDFKDRYKYTVFKQNEFVLPEIDIFKITEQLNVLESGWGGTSTLCCSPRTGSFLAPEVIWNIFKPQEVSYG